MPLQEVTDPPPWVALADAFAALEDATRAVELHRGSDAFDKALAQADIDRAKDRFAAARDRMGLVAAAIFAAAVGNFGGDEPMWGTPDGGYVLPATLRKFAAMVGLDHCLDAMATADERFAQAVGIAKRAYAEAAYLRDEVQKLRRIVEEMQAKRTPGVGEPVLRVVG